MLWYLPYPSWIHPEIIPGLPMRWYGLMYVVAFAITYLLFRWQVAHDDVGAYSKDEVDDLFFKAILLLLVGARLVSQLVYDSSVYNWTHPWMAFWPFRGGRFTGLAGMSYHGGLIGAILGGLWFSRSRHKDFLETCDIACAGIPLGYTFGRLGNFLNGELWGRVSTVPWAMVFPDARRFSTSEGWVRGVMEKVGMEQAGTLVNLPRHPSQLYEALFEGVLLFLFLWFVIRPRKRNHQSGFVLGWYLVGYGFVRFLVEYCRTPDENLGYVLCRGSGADNIQLFSSFLNISLGQIFCLLMMLAGAILLFVRSRRT